MIIRIAESSDIRQITELFKSTVREINSRDYTPEQIMHWQSSADDLPKWQKRIEERYFIVAEEQNTIIGFAYLNQGNYFDGLFVHYQHQGQGIATALANNIEAKVLENGFDSVKSDVSKTARAFFESRGYTIEELQKKPYRGMMFENYIVSKKL